MSGLNRIKKSATKYEENLKYRMYANMTPQQIENAIQIALDTQRKDLINEFSKKITELEKKHTDRLDYTATSITEIISVEFIYEFANQLDFWNLEVNDEEDEYRKESMRFRVAETYENTMKSIEAYKNIKTSKKAHKIFKDKKKRITKEFDIHWK